MYAELLKHNPKIKNKENNFASLKNKNTSNTIWIEPLYWQYPWQNNTPGKKIENVMESFYKTAYLKRPGKVEVITPPEVTMMVSAL
jgi:hypothetical protein